MKVKSSIKVLYNSDTTTYILIGIALVTVLLGAVKIVMLK